MRLSHKYFTDLERFWKYASRSVACWKWAGRIDNSGHSRFDYIGRRNGYGHRFAYDQFCGPIPKGYELHHECGNPACVNPWHLRLLTVSEHRTLTNHQERSYTLQTHCKRGHALTPENRVFHSTVSGRHYTLCRECNRLRRWLVARGLKLNELTAKQVPPRRNNRAISRSNHAASSSSSGASSFSPAKA